jgi:hypothetical protein
VRQINSENNLENYYKFAPELYHSYRTEALVSEIFTSQSRIRVFSKGRKEIEYRDMMEIISGPITLSIWANGDFKLIQHEKVSFWSEELCDLDQYYIC